MFEIYIAVGVILLVAGVLSAVYLILIQKCNCTQRKILSVINAVATISTGIFYIYCSVVFASKVPTKEFPTQIMMEETIVNTTHNEITEDLFKMRQTVSEEPNIINYNIFNTETYDETTTFEEPNNDEENNKINSATNDFLKNYQQLIKNVINGQMHSKKMRSMDISQHECLYHIFLKHAMMVYTFSQNILFLMHCCRECKKCENDKEMELQQEPDKNKQDDSVRYYDLVYVLLLLITPTVCLLSLYYILFGTATVNVQKPDVFEHNWSNKTILNPQIDFVATNNTEIIDIVGKIYKIIGNENSTINKSNDFPNSVENHSGTCNYTGTSLRIYTFLLIILSYLAMIFYLKTLQMKLKNQEASKQLNKCLYTFSSLWLPGIGELFARVFLTGELPSVLSDVFMSLGSGSLLFMNFQNVLAAKKLNKNSIIPVSEADT